MAPLHTRPVEAETCRACLCCLPFEKDQVRFPGIVLPALDCYYSALSDSSNRVELAKATLIAPIVKRMDKSARFGLQSVENIDMSLLPMMQVAHQRHHPHEVVLIQTLHQL
jgi:hypothetical protein